MEPWQESREQCKNISLADLLKLLVINRTKIILNKRTNLSDNPIDNQMIIIITKNETALTQKIQQNETLISFTAIKSIKIIKEMNPPCDAS